MSEELNEDLVSVIIPAYNHERYVQETIQSVIDQTYPCLELIITNDGSVDRTHEKIEAMLPLCEESLARVEYINKLNEGVVRSLNTCLSKARGKYVYFISSDDVADSNAIAELCGFLKQHRDYGLAVGDSVFMDENGETCFWGHAKSIVYDKAKARSCTQAEHYRRKRADVDFYGESFGAYTSLLLGNYIPNGFLIRKDIIDEVGGYSEQAPLEDMYLMLQISKVSKMKFLGTVLFKYRWHLSNTIKQSQLMQEYLHKTIELEIPYAREHGYLDYIPVERNVRFLGLLIYGLRKRQDQIKVYFLNLCVYKKRRKRTSWVSYFLGIPVWKRKVTEEIK
jgi:alpha-1,3-rhamnosyltransferase